MKWSKNVLIFLIFFIVNLSWKSESKSESWKNREKKSEWGEKKGRKKSNLTKRNNATYERKKKLSEMQWKKIIIMEIIKYNNLTETNEWKKNYEYLDERKKIVKS